MFADRRHLSELGRPAALAQQLDWRRTVGHQLARVDAEARDRPPSFVDRRNSAGPHVTGMGQQVPFLVHRSFSPAQPAKTVAF
jgi:hypothetical protein